MAGGSSSGDDAGAGGSSVAGTLQYSPVLNRSSTVDDEIQMEAVDLESNSLLRGRVERGRRRDGAAAAVDESYEVAQPRAATGAHQGPLSTHPAVASTDKVT